MAKCGWEAEPGRDKGREQMEIPGPEQEVAMGGVYIAFKAGHCSLFRGRGQPKTWTPTATFVWFFAQTPSFPLRALRIAERSLLQEWLHWTTHACPSSGAGQHRAKAASLTCLGACETLPGCHRAASLPGEPHLTDSFLPPALPASVTTAWRDRQDTTLRDRNRRRLLAAPEKQGLPLPLLLMSK